MKRSTLLSIIKVCAVSFLKCHLKYNVFIVDSDLFNERQIQMQKARERMQEKMLEASRDYKLKMEEVYIVKISCNVVFYVCSSVERIEKATGIGRKIQ